MYAGLGDVPIRDVYQQTLDARAALAAARNAGGIIDSYTPQAVIAQYGYAPDYGLLSAAPMIAQEILGQGIQKFDTARHTIKRADLLSAISKMKTMAAAIAPAAPVQMVAAPITTAAPVSTSPVQSIIDAVTGQTQAPPAALTTGGSAPLPSIATPAATPISAGAGAPITTVSVTTPAGPTITLPATASELEQDLVKYAPYIIGGGILLFMVMKSKKRRAA